MAKKKSLYDRNDWEEACRVNKHKDMYNLYDWYSGDRDVHSTRVMNLATSMYIGRQSSTAAPKSACSRVAIMDNSIPYYTRLFGDGGLYMQADLFADHNYYIQQSYLLARVRTVKYISCSYCCEAEDRENDIHCMHCYLLRARFYLTRDQLHAKYN
jgi:hypothetical protein